MTLYEIDKAIAELFNNVDEETGEILFSIDELEQLEIAADIKCENIACYKKNLDADIDALKKEEQALAKRRKSKESLVKRLKDSLLIHLENTGQSKIETTRAVISMRMSKQVKIIDETLIPKEYIKTEYSVMKSDIKKKLLDDVEVAGAVIVENKSIQVR